MWDYIVVGAGSAGCVLANRLSADPSRKVLVLEAGGPDEALRFKVPALGSLNALGRPHSDWMLTSEPDPTRNGRQDPAFRGKVLGGSSSVNGTIYVRGNREDYDLWAKMGCIGWDFDSLLPYFKRLECDRRGASAAHGTSGPMRISRTRGVHPLARTFIAAMGQLGIPANPDYNGEHQMGASVPFVTQHRGWRWSAARGYLDPARRRANLAILTNAFARRIVIEKRRAVGVELEREGHCWVERCSAEILVCASVFNSPKLLMLSGIGDPEQLRSLGIPIECPNPSVGKNLQEHPNVAVKCYVRARTSNMDVGLLRRALLSARFGILGSGQASYVFPAIAFVNLDSRSPYPELQLHFGAFAMESTPQGRRMLDRPAVTVQANVNRSESRGYVRLRSSDPGVPPLIQPNLLASSRDLAALVAGIQLVRKLFRTEAFRTQFEGEFAPGHAVTTASQLEAYVRATAGMCYHSCGTLKMGNDDSAVVDPRLQVMGLDGLRVIDSSVIPQVPCGNINAISMVIGEKGADMILQDRELSRRSAGTWQLQSTTPTPNLLS